MVLGRALTVLGHDVWMHIDDLYESKASAWTAVREQRAVIASIHFRRS
jgi:hypothetical protein